MYIRSIITSAIIISSLLLIQACGDMPDQNILHWDKLPFEYYIDADVPYEAQEKIIEGGDIWNSISGKEIVIFKKIKNFTHDETPYNGDNPRMNVIHITNSPFMAWNEDEQKLIPTDYLAVAVPRVGKHNRIIDCDIYVFNYNENFVVGRDDSRYNGNPADLSVTIAHEIGHCLGFPHSDDPKDIMFPSHAAHSEAIGWGNQSPGPGDVRALFNIYPDLEIEAPAWALNLLEEDTSPSQASLALLPSYNSDY